MDPVEPMCATLAMTGEQPLDLVHSLYHRSTWTTGDYLQELFVVGPTHVAAGSAAR
ncbi:hypothetical protein ACVWW5_000943 [Bradyrhizobium sp. LM3.4]